MGRVVLFSTIVVEEDAVLPPMLQTSSVFSERLSALFPLHFISLLYDQCPVTVIFSSFLVFLFFNMYIHHVFE